MEPPFAPPTVEPSPPPAPYLPPRTVTVSQLEWESARTKAGEWHASQARAAQWSPHPWVSVSAAPVPSRRRRFAVIGALAVVGVAGGATAAVVLRDQPAAAFSLEAAAVQAQDTSTLSFTLEMGMDDGSTVSADISMDVERELMAMKMEMPPEGEFDFVVDLDGNTMYLSTDADAFEPMVFNGAEWIQFDMDDEMDIDMSEMLDQVDDNPFEMAAAFETADGVREMGFETVAGQEAKKYEITVDTAEAIADPEMRDLFESTLGDLDTMPDEMVFDAYVTEDNQIVRLAYEMDIMGATTSFDITITGTDDVVIVVPDPSTVMSFDELGF